MNLKLLRFALVSIYLIQFGLSDLVTTTTEEDLKLAQVETDSEEQLKPIISKFHIRSDVQYRYAKTVVRSHVKNPGRNASNIAFDIVMPKAAFISNFSMIIRSQEYVAEVEEKEAAQKTYDKAVESGQSAGEY